MKSQQDETTATQAVTPKVGITIVIYEDFGLTLSLRLDDQVVMMYLITARCSLIETTMTQATLFIPKVCIVIVISKDIGLTLSLLLDD